jgi:hypothetical protein
MRLTFFDGVFAIAVCGTTALIASDSLTVLAVAVLLVCLKLVDTDDNLFVLAAAVTFHWSQTSLGLLYKPFSGREPMAMVASDYQPMVLIGLACVLMIALGIRLALTFIRPPVPDEDRPLFAFRTPTLVVAYAAGVLFEGTLSAIAPEYPSIRQLLVTIDLARLGVLFLILRRTLNPVPHWTIFCAVIAIEVGLGVTGYFAGFREPMVLGAIAMLEIFDRRNTRHWTAMAVAGTLAVALGVLWMGVRVDYRRDYVQVDSFSSSRSVRAERISGLITDFVHSDSTYLWQTADALVDRMWAVYYPALALKRVPSVLPHTHGEILSAALVHIATPRVFFPNKPELPSDSDEVRKYSGVMVAGREQGTSIAFGYAPEAYIDFGIPLMFVPVFFFGVAMGASYGWARRLIWHRELFVAYATVSIWLSLYLFERSWATLLGVALGFVVYLGVPVLILDRTLLVRHFKQREQHEGLSLSPETSVP